MRNIRIMLDCETLATSAVAIVFDVGLRVSFEDDDERPIFEETFILPIQPQLDMGRELNYDTLLFHFKNGAIDRIFEESCQGDSVDLGAYLRKFVRKIESAIDLAGGGKYTIWTKGNFDVPILESLLSQCGIPVPWHFRRIADLRTLLDVAEVDYKNYDRREEEPEHTGLGDARFQDRLYLIATRAIASGKAPAESEVNERAPKLPSAPTSIPERKLPFNATAAAPTQPS